MAGYSPMKRPYPGEWGGPTRGAKEARPPGMEDYGAPVHGGWTNTGYSSYEGYDYFGGAPPPAWGDYSGYNAAMQPAAPVVNPTPTAAATGTTTPAANVDFTDDYSVFYSKSDRGRGGNQNRGGFRGRGNTRGNFSGAQGTGSTGGQNTQSQSGGRWNNNRGRGRGGVQRGMPPNQFNRGRARGTGKPGSVVAPVHSLAKAKPAFMDLQNMSLAEKLHRFCLYLRNDEAAKVNAIQTIMNAMTSSKLGLSVKYDAEELTRVSGKAMYTGVMKLDDVFLARAIRPNKKELKQEVFTKALNVMLSMTVAEIFNLVDPGADAIREELSRQMQEDEGAKKDLSTGDSSGMLMKTLIGSDIPTVLGQLITAILNMKRIPDNPICTLEQASSQAHSIAKHEYKMEPLKLNNGRTYHKGSLSYAGIIVGWGVGMTKKACKFDTYENALQRLKEKKLDELIKSMPDPGLPEGVSREEGATPDITKVCMKNLSVEQRFEELIRALCAMAFKEGNINLIDITAMQNGLTPMVIFKSGTPNSDPPGTSLICELYIEKILIATSEGTRKRDCQNKVYNSAFEVLTTTSAEQILQQHKKITDEEIKNPANIDVYIKGSAKSVDSNIQGLKRLNHKIEDVLKNDPAGMVIMEHGEWAKDRIRSAFCILQFSCTQNALLLQWECDQVKNKFRCVMTLQKQPVGESYGANKTHARNLAATDALFKLYETNQVVKITPRLSDKDLWVPFDTIQEKADKLRNENVGEEPIMKSDEHGNPLPDTFLLKVLKKMVDEFVGRKKMEELLFGPGIGLLETREVRSYAREFDVRSDIRQYQGEPYLLLYWKLEWKKLVEVLKQRAGRTYGKFYLVEREELPNHATIAGNIITELEDDKKEDEGKEVKIEVEIAGSETK